MPFFCRWTSLLKTTLPLPTGDAHQLAVKFVDLFGFQAGTAVHLGRDGAVIPSRVVPDQPRVVLAGNCFRLRQPERKAWLAADEPQLGHSHHSPVTEEQVARQRASGVL